MKVDPAKDILSSKFRQSLKRKYCSRNIKLYSALCSV